MEVSPNLSKSAKELRAGTWAAIASYGMWGLFPIYWKQITDIDAVHILCHRVLWSALFLLLVMQITGLAKQLIPIFKNWRSLISVIVCAILITINWGTYIWAVNAGRVTESSLGYYITPLLSICLGSLFFKEKLDSWATTAVIFATIGVAIAAFMIGKIPWVSLSLATSFSIYGVIKKKVGLDALAGLTAETITATPFVLIWLLWAQQFGWGYFFGPGAKSVIFLTVAGPVTAIPLLAFAYAAIRIPLQRIGFIQYLSPTFQLVLGIMVYGEKMTPPMLLAFSTVVAAVVIYLASRKWVAAKRH
ncbi:MAG: EamA family transporter RarD [Holophagaceae bacterium]|nr:EamA family transporter RarD [Holophagaceae bacterium]